MIKAKEVSLSESLKRLGAITEWFEMQDEIDVEQALEKIKEGVVLLKTSRARLKSIENEFQVIKKELETES